MAASAKMTRSGPPPLKLEFTKGIARLTLDRPQRLNTIDLPMARALMDATVRISRQDDVRVVALLAAGPTFCGGGDLKAFAQTGAELPSHLYEVTTFLHPALSLLARLDAPVVAGVRGAAAGAGLGLICAADVVVAAESARFAFAYSAIGLTPDAGTSWTLPRLVGPRRAMELALTNRVLTAAEAVRSGLVTSMVADDDLDAVVETLLSSLAAAPTGALGTTKRLMRTAFDVGFAERLATEGEELSRAASSSDGREGIAAFLAKRAPDFQGR